MAELRGRRIRGADAALLIHDGWTLEEAVSARCEGIVDEHFYP
jgi:hypothetical protein